MDSLDTIRDSSERLAAAASGNADVAVTHYPEWTLNDLLIHTGAVYGRTTEIVRTRPRERVRRSFPDDEAPDAVMEWFRSRTAEMIDELAAADLGVPVWGYGPSPTIGFWLSRMVFESTVHAHDAEESVGDPAPIPADLAADGIDEYGMMWGDHISVESDPLQMLAGDTDDRWLLTPRPDGGITFERGATGRGVIVTGSAADLYLWVLARADLSRFVTTGDAPAWHGLFHGVPLARR